MATRQASRQPSLGISSVVTWRGRPWISSVDTWRGRPPAPADTAHRTSCTENCTKKYMTPSFNPRSVWVALWQWCNEPSHSRWVGALVEAFKVIQLRRPGYSSVLARWNETSPFSREQATVEKKMFNGFVQSTTSTSGRGTKFKTELMRVECWVSTKNLREMAIKLSVVEHVDTLHRWEKNLVNRAFFSIWPFMFLKRMYENCCYSNHNLFCLMNLICGMTLKNINLKNICLWIHSSLKTVEDHRKCKGFCRHTTRYCRELLPWIPDIWAEDQMDVCLNEESWTNLKRMRQFPRARKILKTN